MVPAPWGLESGQKLPKIDQYSKIFSTTAHVEEKCMHGDIEQEGPYQNREIYNPWGSGFAPMVGPNMMYSLLTF
jgi:hypothetical protein